jgi:hypothetical protein
MIITDQFVMLNLPKTGSSFARKAIKLIYEKRFGKLSFIRKFAVKLKLSEPLVQDLVLPNIRIKAVKKHPDHHGTFRQIPAKHKQKNVFSIVRNPYERLISVYEFKDWVRNQPLSAELIAQNFPGFPELSLDEFIDLSKMIIEAEIRTESQKVKIGLQSLQFIHMFFKNPEKVLLEINDDYIDSDKYLNDMIDITFLRQEFLREDMKNYLRSYGFEENELKIIDGLGIVNETKNKSKNRNALLTPKAIEYINTEERFILKILRQKGIEYSYPQINNFSIPVTIENSEITK